MKQLQQAICKRYGVSYSAPDAALKAGISDLALFGDTPLHGLRHPPEDGTSGWFIWAGQWSNEPDFFKPYHVNHLSEICPKAIPYLALPPGWRFLVAPDYEDVWFDEKLLTI